MLISSAGNVGKGVLCSRTFDSVFGGVDGTVRFSDVNATATDVNASVTAVIVDVNTCVSRGDLRL